MRQRGSQFPLAQSEVGRPDKLLDVNCEIHDGRRPVMRLAYLWFLQKRLCVPVQTMRSRVPDVGVVRWAACLIAEHRGTTIPAPSLGIPSYITRTRMHS